MPDSISQSTATVLRINGREMSYCAIFVRDLCARPSPVPRVLRLSSAKRVSFIPSLAEADIAVTRPANAPAGMSCLPFVLGYFVFFFSLFYIP